MRQMSPLRRRMIEDMTIRNLSPATQRSYIHAVKKFSAYFGKSPDRLGLEEVRVYQVHLASRGVAWATLNQIVCALRFFYGVTLGASVVPERIPYARQPRKLPVVLSGEEVVRVLEAVPSLKCRTALTTAYAAGLRVSEVVALRVDEIDSRRMVIKVAHGKGDRERRAMLSEQLLGILRTYWKLARPAPWLFPGRTQAEHLHPAARYAACRPGFFLPVRVLSRLFRRLFLEKLAAAHEAGRLRFFGDHAHLADAKAFANFLDPLRDIDWVVYAKPPFAGPEAVLGYLSRYTHRVAIATQSSPRRLPINPHSRRPAVQLNPVSMTSHPKANQTCLPLRMGPHRNL